MLWIVAGRTQSAPSGDPTMSDANAKETCDGATVSGAASGSPCRVQLSRRKGWRMPANTVKVDRTTRWGNPFACLPFEECRRRGLWYAPNREAAVKHFEIWLSAGGFGPTWKDQLRGKNLACWCKPGTPCHAETLLRLANDSRELRESSSVKLHAMVGRDFSKGNKT